jgi:hypothetical protein
MPQKKAGASMKAKTPRATSQRRLAKFKSGAKKKPKEDAPRLSMKLEFRGVNIALDNLLLDPNNYRFLDNRSYKKKIKTKYHLPAVQESTLGLLERDKKYQLSELKKSILANGYIPMERIIVVPYKYDSGKFLVIEGNRRVAALKSLLQENEESVIELSASEVKQFSTIPCAVLQSDPETLPHAERVIMGIRHIAGPKEWGAYQQAQLILELFTNEGYDFKTIGEHLGISTVDVARRYRAMNALKQMEGDDFYGEKAVPEFYRLFHELVSLPDVRIRFGWNNDVDAFTDIDQAREFFELIAPREEDGEAKLKTYSDVRKLKFIVGDPSAESLLMDPEKSVEDALAASRSVEGSVPRASKGLSIGKVLDEILAHLQSVDLIDLEEFHATDKKKISTITNLLKRIQKFAG